MGERQSLDEVVELKTPRKQITDAEWDAALAEARATVAESNRLLRADDIGEAVKQAVLEASDTALAIVADVPSGQLGQIVAAGLSKRRERSAGGLRRAERKREERVQDLAAIEKIAARKQCSRSEAIHLHLSRQPGWESLTTSQQTTKAESFARRLRNAKK